MRSLRENGEAVVGTGSGRVKLTTWLEALAGSFCCKQIRNNQPAGFLTW